MKTVNVYIVLLGILVVMAAFVSVCSTNAMKNLSATDNKGFAVVELFTSEGCSSCPPAEELAARIQRQNNPQIYILAFHVDYWDHQGWKDKFSDPAFSERQQRYAGWLHLNTVYTPQVVVNGTTQQVGADQGAVLGAISDGLKQAAPKPLTLTGSIERGRINVGYQGAGDEKNTALVVALVQKAAQSNVWAGENSGRTLSHVQIVRQVRQLSLDAHRKKEIMLDLPGGFNEKDWELIGFVQRQADGRITAAARFSFQGGAVTAQ